MAQSRLELIGTIYSRVTGLIKSGAIKSEQVPLWYNVYESFPPKYEPRWDRQVEEKPVRKILYQEDFVRAKYYKTFGNREVVNLFKDEKPTSQVFVDKYVALSQADGVSEQELWDRTVSSLELEGVNLGGNLGLDKGNKEEEGDKMNKKKHQISFQKLFSDES